MFCNPFLIETSDFKGILLKIIVSGAHQVSIKGPDPAEYRVVQTQRSPTVDCGFAGTKQ